MTPTPKPAAVFACELTSIRQEIACPGLDGGDHSETCRTFGRFIERRDVEWSRYFTSTGLRPGAPPAPAPCAYKHNGTPCRVVGQHEYHLCGGTKIGPIEPPAETEEPKDDGLCATCGHPQCTWGSAGHPTTPEEPK